MFVEWPFPGHFAVALMTVFLTTEVLWDMTACCWGIGPRRIFEKSGTTRSTTLISQTFIFRYIVSLTRSVGRLKETRVVTSGAEAKCIGRVMRRNMQCGIDSSTAIMLVLLMECCDLH